MQLTFGDAEDLGKRKQTQREIFLGEMPHYPTSGRRGRRPYALETMLRIHLLQ